MTPLLHQSCQQHWAPSSLLSQKLFQHLRIQKYCWEGCKALELHHLKHMIIDMWYVYSVTIFWIKLPPSLGFIISFGSKRSLLSLYLHMIRLRDIFCLKLPSFLFVCIIAYINVEIDLNMLWLSWVSVMNVTCTRLLYLAPLDMFSITLCTGDITRSM